MLTVSVNGQDYAVEIDQGTPLLWVLRDQLNLTGTKFGCGAGHCGACTVQIDGRPVRSCSVLAADLTGKAIVTIEGATDLLGLAVRAAWIEEQVPQCGYCQSGMIMAAIALLRVRPEPTDAEIDGAITNLCRCGSYDRVRKAIRRAAVPR